jgi:hypothetical protein
MMKLRSEEDLNLLVIGPTTQMNRNFSDKAHIRCWVELRVMTIMSLNRMKKECSYSIILMKVILKTLIIRLVIELHYIFLI